MKKVSKLLFIIPFILILFACGKKTIKTNKTTEKYYNVSFFNYDNSLIKTIKVKEGEKPVYDGDIPVKNATNLGYEYDFIGWGPSITETYSDANYFAQYSDLKIKKEMQNFIFASTKDKCIIEGIKDNTVTNIVVPEYVTSIDYGSFKNCSSLASITIPFVGDKAHISTDTYQYPFGYIFGKESYTGGTKTQQYYYGSSTSDTTSATYYIPTTLKEVIITGSSYIQHDSFYNCSNLTSITIPNSVTSIGKSAFYNCTGLTSITIPDSVKSIGEYAFYNCTGLTSITIPDSVKSIGEFAFFDCTGLTSITIPNSVTSIGSGAFYNCSNLTNVYYNGTIEDWCNITFSSVYSNNPMRYASNFYILDENGDIEYNGNKYRLFNDTELVLSNTATKIGSYSLYNFKQLTSITIPNSVTSIGSGAFYNCSNLTSITIPNSVTSIGGNAFYQCSNLTSITIPNSVTSIGSGAFSRCSNLVSIKLPFVGDKAHISTDINQYPFGYIFGRESYTGGTSTVQSYYDGYSPSCTTSATYYIPTALKEVIITGSSYIQYGSFYNCSNLTSITIPNSVTSIGDFAFYNCSNLTNVYYNGTIEDWSNISIGSYNGWLNVTIIYYYSETEPTESGNYWHYVDGEIVIW